MPYLWPGNSELDQIKSTNHAAIGLSQQSADAAAGVFTRTLLMPNSVVKSDTIIKRAEEGVIVNRWRGKKEAVVQHLLIIPAQRSEDEEDTNSIGRRVTNIKAVHCPLSSIPALAQSILEPPTNLHDLADRLEAGANDWIKDDNVLLGILLGPFEANWFKAKACLTLDNWPTSVRKAPPHALSLRLMEAIVDMRGRKWEAFARKTLSKIRTEVERVAATSQFVFEAPGSKERLLASKDEELSMGGAVGCQCVTSDMDFSLTGANSEIGIGLIHRAFAEEFGVSFQPGTVFDINVYCTDWMHGQIEINKDVNSPIATFIPEYEQRALPSELEDRQERANTLEMWSLVKMRCNMTPEQWATYATTTVAFINQDKAGARDAMHKMLLEAEFEYWSFQVRLETRLEVMDATLKLQQESSRFGYGHDLQAPHKSPFGHANEEYVREAREMRASDSLYQETALQVRDLRIRLDILTESAEPHREEISKLAKQLAFKIAEGLAYANEAYVTEGALFHTVYGKQAAERRVAQLRAEGRSYLTTVKFILRPEHYLQSLNENVGYAVRSLNKFHRQPQYAVYRAGKSIARLCEAAELLLSDHAIVAAGLRSYATLKEIGAEAVRAKAHEVGRNPKCVYTDPYFGDFDSPAHLYSLSSHVIYFGAAAAAMFHNR